MSLGQQWWRAAVALLPLVLVPYFIVNGPDTSDESLTSSLNDQLGHFFAVVLIGYPIGVLLAVAVSGVLRPPQWGLVGLLGGVLNVFGWFSVVIVAAALGDDPPGVALVGAGGLVLAALATVLVLNIGTGVPRLVGIGAVVLLVQTNDAPFGSTVTPSDRVLQHGLASAPAVSYATLAKAEGLS